VRAPRRALAPPPFLPPGPAAQVGWGCPRPDTGARPAPSAPAGGRGRMHGAGGVGGARPATCYASSRKDVFIPPTHTRYYNAQTVCPCPHMHIMRAASCRSSCPSSGSAEGGRGASTYHATVITEFSPGGVGGSRGGTS